MKTTHTPGPWIRPPRPLAAIDDARQALEDAEDDWEFAPEEERPMMLRRIKDCRAALNAARTSAVDPVWPMPDMHAVSVPDGYPDEE